MAYSLQIDADAVEPLASLKGMVDLKRWVRTLPSDEGERLRHLLEYGWAQDVDELAREAATLIEEFEPARADVRSTVRDLIRNLRRAEMVVSITDGLGIESGSEDKFNPYHDPRTGRFTTPGGGGGGGAVGGGGGEGIGSDAAPGIDGPAVRAHLEEKLGKSYDAREAAFAEAKKANDAYKADPTSQSKYKRAKAAYDRAQEAKGAYESAARQEVVRAMGVEKPASIHSSVIGLEGTAAESANGGARFISSLIPGDAAVAKEPMRFRASPGGERSFYDTGGVRAIHLSSGVGAHIAVHEAGHWLEDRSPNARQLANDFVARRTKGEPSVSLAQHLPGYGYGSDERSRPDKFIDPYIGKSYGSGATEVLSMGLEYLHKDPIKLIRADREHFDLTINALKSLEKS